MTTIESQYLLSYTINFMNVSISLYSTISNYNKSPSQNQPVYNRTSPRFINALGGLSQVCRFVMIHFLVQASADYYDCMIIVFQKLEVKFIQPVTGHKV